MKVNEKKNSNEIQHTDEFKKKEGIGLDTERD